jgi:hypothetical protein
MESSAPGIYATSNRIARSFVEGHCVSSIEIRDRVPRVGASAGLRDAMRDSGCKSTAATVATAEPSAAAAAEW